MTLHEWVLFMTIWIAASVPLGPNALNCISTSAAFGFRTGLWSVVGVMIAAVIHMSLAVTGLAAFMVLHPQLFDVIRWLGVIYLAWMGVSMFRASSKIAIDRPLETVSKFRLVGKAILISLSNPKAIFAWLAIFSQFVNAGQPLAGQLVILAPSALVVTLLVYCTYSALGGRLTRLLAGRRKFWFDRFAGSTYLAFAFGLATTDLRRA